MKRNKQSGVLVILLSLIMVISMMPVGVFAVVDGSTDIGSEAETVINEEGLAEAEGDTDADDPATDVINDSDISEDDGQSEDMSSEVTEEAAPEKAVEKEAEEVTDLDVDKQTKTAEPKKAAPEENMLKATAAAVPDSMRVDPSETNGLPSTITLFKRGTGTNYELYLPGNVDAANCYFSWDEDITATSNNRTYASGECPIPTPGSAAVTYSFRSGTQTATFKVTSYQGSPGVTPIFIEIDESNGNPTIAQMDADANHEVTCTGTIYIDGQHYVLDKMKGRGNASWKESDDKKPYNITLGSKITFPGIDEAETKKWTLLAEVLDHSLLCNRSGYHLAHELGIGQDTASTDVWMNGEYQGCYTITPKTDSYVTKDGYQVEQDNYKEDPVTQGGDPQFTLEGLKEASGWDSCYNRITVKKMGDNLLKNAAGEVDESPESMEAASDKIRLWLQDAWDAIRSDTGRNSKGKYYTDYIDIESFAKMYLMHEYVKSYDVCAGSILFHRDGQTDDYKLVAGPLWDLDNAMGSVYQNSSLGRADDRRNGDRRSAEGEFIPNITEYKTSIYKTIYKHDDFKQEVKRQYNLNRSKFNRLDTDTQQMIDAIHDSAMMNHVKVNDLGHNQGKNNHYYGSNTNFGSGQFQQTYLATTNSTTDWSNYAANLKTYITVRSKWFNYKFYDSSIVDPDTCEHQYQETVTKQATCTETGIVTYTCPICHNTYTETIPKIAHDYQDGACTVCGEVLKTATISCSEGASVTVYETQDLNGAHQDNATSANPRDGDSGLIDCSGEGQINFAVKLAEGYELDSVTVAPKASYNKLKELDDPGVPNGYRITKVNDNLTITVTTRCIHNYGDLIAEKAPTCTEAGTAAHYQCSRCSKLFVKDGDEYIEKTAAELTIAALGHDPEHHPAKAASCQLEGNIEYWTCKRSGCGKYFSDEACTEEITAEQTVTARTEHTWNDGEITTPPTCTEKGVKTYTCTKCSTTRIEDVAALGHDPVHHEAVAATCEADGSIEYWTCKRDGCGKYFSDEDCTEEITAADTVIPKKNHSWNEGEITTQPTCMEKGVKTFTCTVCSKTRTEEIAALGHDPEHHEAVAATCEKDGSIEYWTCKRDGCGKYFSDEDCTEEITAADTVIPKKNHSWNEGEITTQPTCTEKGEKTFTCTVCSKTRTEEIAALGHDPEHHEAVAATCEADGSIEYWTCKRDGCGKYFSDEDCTEEITAADTVIPKKNHSWNEGEITTQPTCTEKGVKTFTCTVCSKTRTEEIAALGHDPEHHEAVAATCEADGNIEYWTCKRDGCGKYFSDEDCTEEITAADTVIPKKNHSWNEGEITTQPTCTEKGVKTFTCTVCSKTRTEEVPALGHDPEHHEAVAATCEKAGNIEYWTCKRDGCGKYFSDEDCTEEITAADTVIPKKNHSWNEGEITTQPTCTEKGVKTFTCSVCSKTRTEEIAALGHDPVHHEAVAATCEKDGSIEYWTCKRDGCGKYFSDEDCTEEITAADTVIEKKGHTPETDAAVAPTCTQKGKTEGSHCSVCGKVIKAQEDVAALGHDYVLDEDSAVAPTCTEPGREADKECSRCHTKVKGRSVPATGHKWDSGTVTEKASTTSTGRIVYTCTACQETRNETIPKAAAPTGKPIIRNTIANSAKRTNDAIWDKSSVKGATGYILEWRARGASKWASKKLGDVSRGVTSGLTIGNLYEIRVTPYKAETATTKEVKGTSSDIVYRYFHTTETIRLASRSKGTFTMSWKSNPNATSYQVLYTTNANGAGAAQNIKTVAKGGSSITVSDIKVNGKTQALKSGTTYYVQVREIRNVGGKNYIGNISCPVAVKVK